MVEAMTVYCSCALVYVRRVVFFFEVEDGIRDWSVAGVQTCVFFFQAEDGIRDWSVTGVQTCALPISSRRRHTRLVSDWSSDVCSSDLSTRLNPVTDQSRMPSSAWIQTCAQIGRAHV